MPLTNEDIRLARNVLKMDDEIDSANKQMYVILQDWMHKNPDSIERAVHLLSASRNLERIADLVTNIAEDVVYMAEGELIRHQVEDFRERSTE